MLSWLQLMAEIILSVRNALIRGRIVTTKHWAKDVHLEYRRQYSIIVERYQQALEGGARGYAQQLAAHAWREGLLAEAWGLIATKLSREGIDYMKRWSQGE